MNDCFGVGDTYILVITACFCDPYSDCDLFLQTALYTIFPGAAHLQYHRATYYYFVHYTCKIFAPKSLAKVVDITIQ